MKRLLLISTFFLAGQWGCQTDLEPRLRKSRVDLPTPVYVFCSTCQPQRKLTINYQVVYGLDLIKSVNVGLIDTPPQKVQPVDGKETTPDNNGRGSFTITNLTSGRTYEYKVEAIHKDGQIPTTIAKGLFTIP